MARGEDSNIGSVLVPCNTYCITTNDDHLITKGRSHGSYRRYPPTQAHLSSTNRQRHLVCPRNGCLDASLSLHKCWT